MNRLATTTTTLHSTTKALHLYSGVIGIDIRNYEEVNIIHGRFQAHQQRADEEEEEEDDDDDDDDSLESLSGISSTRSIEIATLKILLEHMDECMQFFRGLLPFQGGVIGGERDPMALLCSYYQKKNIPAITHFFTEEHVQTKTAVLWRCSFTCPLTGRRVTSGLPSILLLGLAQQNQKQQNKEEKESICLDIPESIRTSLSYQKLVDAVRTILGPLPTLENAGAGFVYFSNKKVAKKSCALAFLPFISYANSINPLFASSVEQAKEALSSLVSVCDPQINVFSPTQQHQEGKSLATESTADEIQLNSLSTQEGSDSTSLFPTWVQDLYRYGVSHLKITYLEDWENRRLDWTLEPTLIRCVLFVPESALGPVQVVGDAYALRFLARDDAIAKLLLRLETTCQPKHVLQQWKRSVNTTLEHCTNILTRLLSSDDPTIYFCNPMPDWAFRPFPTKKDTTASNNTNNNVSLLYLYELVLRTRSGSSWVASRMKMVENETDDWTTRIGVLFPADIEPTGGVFEEGQPNERFFPSEASQADLRPFRWTVNGCSRLSINNNDNDDNDDDVIVAVTNRTVLDDRLLAEQLGPLWLSNLQRYNRVLQCWKTYGIGYEKCLQDSRDADHLDGRTYLFAPLVRTSSTATTTSDMSGNDDGRQLAIDWQQVCQEVEHRWLPFLPCADNENHPQSGLNNETHPPCHSSQGATNPSAPGPTLENRVLFHGKIRYIATGRRGHGITGRSLFPQENLTEEKRKYHMEKHGIDLKGATFAEYMENKYKLKINFSGEEMIEAYHVRKLAEFNPFLPVSEIEQQPADPVFIMPELTKVLPVPLDFLFVMGVIGKIMSTLEEEIILKRQTIQLLRTAADIHQTKPSPPLPMTCQESLFQRTNQLSLLLKEATTLFPVPSYERLEFLGDTVLGFVTILHVMTSNFLLLWDHDDLQEAISQTVSNHSLTRAAIRLGVPKLCCTILPWQSAYRVGKVLTDDASKHPGLALVQRMALADSKLSDVVESLLAVAYLFDMDERRANEAKPGPSLTRTILNQMSLAHPFSCSRSSWLVCDDPCFRHGYPFHTQRPWNKTLASIWKLISNHGFIHSELETGFCALLAILEKNCGKSLADQIGQGHARTLLFCALFDDDLDGTTNVPETFVQVALCRVTLFQVGSRALQLIFSEEAFRRFPDANPTDLHLLRSCALADDALAYITVKTAIHTTFFDKHSECAELFLKFMEEADESGMAEWNEKGGWCLDGGVDEFRRRCYPFTGGKINCPTVPRYPGLQGGRLCGIKNKMRNSLTDELSFSFKTIVGALVLSVGLDAMWECICPLFVELLLLTPSEIRMKYSEDSTLVKAY